MNGTRPRSMQNLTHDHEVLIRLVTSFATQSDQVDRFVNLLG